MDSKFEKQFKVMLQSCIILGFSCMGNYGFLFFTMEGNLLVNNVIMTSFDALGFVILMIIVEKLGRVRMMKYSFFFTGVFLISSSGVGVLAMHDDRYKLFSNILGKQIQFVNHYV
jgi:hypothetical protein